MKVVTFFMSKGGTGKTSFNIMFASYLTYILGRKVLEHVHAEGAIGVDHAVGQPGKQLVHAALFGCTGVDAAFDLADAGPERSQLYLQIQKAGDDIVNGVQVNEHTAVQLCQTGQLLFQKHSAVQADLAPAVGVALFCAVVAEKDFFVGVLFHVPHEFVVIPTGHTHINVVIPRDKAVMAHCADDAATVKGAFQALLTADAIDFCGDLQHPRVTNVHIISANCVFAHYKVLTTSVFS